MALTDLQMLRLKIADRAHLVLGDVLGQGDGTNKLFRTRIAGLVLDSDQVFVAGVQKTRDVDYTIDLGLGLITFVVAPVLDAEVTAHYQWVTFSDIELGDLLTSMSVLRAAIEAIRWLLADQDRFLKYTFGQETVDRQGARQGLVDLLDELRREVTPSVGLVKADTPDREALMFPFIQQGAELVDVE